MDTALTVFILICAFMVLFMTPAVSFFYGGMSRKKNVGNTISMCLLALGVVGILWAVEGYSLAFDGQFAESGLGQFIGGFGQLFLNGTDTMAEDSFVSGLPDMVWGGGLIGGTLGALDFAGGDVVHISSGVAGLTLCLICGARRGFGHQAYRAHNTPMVALGAFLLWFGWLGFNSGSALCADDGVAAIAGMNTIVASAAAALSWLATEKIATGKSTLVGGCTGLVAGLVVITPAAGFVATWAALVMGIIVSPVCFLCISKLKAKLGYDDALDAFGCHGIGGILGGILTGIFCVPELSWNDMGGLLYTGDPSLLIAQIEGIVITIIFVAIATAIIAFIVKACCKGSLAVSSTDEGQGMDVAQHGESAYPAFDGLD